MRDQRSRASHPYAVCVPEFSFEQELAQWDAIARGYGLSRLKVEIQKAIDVCFSWGQFEVWWRNPHRTNTLEGIEYQHDDKFLLALLKRAQKQDDSDRRRFGEPGVPREKHASNSNVRDAWGMLCRFFEQDASIEQWKMGDWQPDDMRGPDRPGA
jgi:hypothetical protein